MIAPDSVPRQVAGNARYGTVVPRAHQDAAQQIAAELVGAEPMPRAGGARRPRKLDRVGIVRCERRAEHHREDDGREDENQQAPRRGYPAACAAAGRTGSLIADALVEQRVGDIGEEVDDRVGRGHDQAPAWIAGRSRASIATISARPMPGMAKISSTTMMPPST